MKTGIKLTLAAIALTTASFATTITTTSGFTSTQSGLSGTVTYAGQTPTDTGSNTVFTGATYDTGTNPGTGHTDFLSQNVNQTTTVNFKNAVSYVGFYWATPDAYNTLTIYNGSTVIGTYTGTAVGASYTNPAYANIFAGSGQVITSIVMTSSQCCFETDNLSYAIAAPATPTPEPTTFLEPAIAIAAWFGLRRLRAARA